MAESIFDLQAELCQTMSNATRLRIVHSLRVGPQCVGKLREALEVDQAQVSHHLAALRSRGIVTATRQGGEVIYQITNPKIETICDLMREVLAEQAAARTEMIQLLERGR